MKYPGVFLILVLVASTAHAQSDSSSYSLFNPVPKDKMREFSIDRPDVTESPFSVDAGHFQFEGDFFRWEKAYRNDAPTQLIIWNGLYKMGITNRIDFHVGIETYNIYKDSEGNTVEKGYGNTTFRLKYNFWGNDGETRSGLGTIIYTTLPTSAVDTKASYGISFPFSYDLSDKLGLGLQPQFDLEPTDNDDYALSYLQTVVIGGPVVGNLDFYFEFVGIFGESDSLYTMNGGLIYNISPNVKLDIAGNLGLTEEAYSNIFTGLSFRL